MIKRIYIEITNICDLNCFFCSKNHRSPVHMDPAFFENVLKQALLITDHIYLHVQGEPTLHPRFEELLDICDRYEANVHLVTNGSFLKKYPTLTAHKCLNTVAVSVQSVSARPSETVPVYFENILSFARIASGSSTVNVDIRFWRSETDEDKNTAYCLEQLKKQYSMQVTKRKNSYMIMPHVFVSFANDFSWPQQSDRNKSDHGTCLGGRMQLAVLSDGTVVPCCLDAEGIISLGNLHEETLEAVIKKPRYLSMVRGFEKHFLTEDLCRACTFRNRFDH